MHLSHVLLHQWLILYVLHESTKETKPLDIKVQQAQA
jgi:hypothetical protein